MQEYDENRQQAIAIVESLRSGIPTRASTRELPDLRPSLTRLVKQDLAQLAQDKIPQGRLVWGAYGQGKTHALTTIEHIALDLGFAVSRVSLSREVSCHHLFNFYGRAASAIRTPNSQIFGIQPALDKKEYGDLPDSPIQDPDRYIHPLPAIVLEDYFKANGEERDLLYGDLMGTRLAISDLRRIHRACRGEALPKFESTFGVKKHGSAYFGVMADTLTWCGYKGWVILIDEVELIGRLGKVGRLDAYRNLNWLLNWSGTMPYPIYTVGVAALSLRNDLWLSSDPIQNAKRDRQQIPDLAGLKLGHEAKAEVNKFFETALGRQCPTTEPLSQDKLSKLLESLVERHRIAYAWDAQLDVHSLIRDMGSQPVRTHIRAALEALDINYTYQEIIIPEAANLVEGSVEEEEGFFQENESE
ncbi:hypothetical protein C7Y66_10860 [Chroococcidiopsis sp. CCALA 051]|uniref:BREX system ATP-binding domain-containing protein n=1 Tax=Chroococcidiopsis sp. CCALA 051 TaxID=869949 RepID=UPI000D0D04BB|nr:BREX system ATP-binding domain-containing protein [Chroococcidiopsis sp. CCALA 051]PSM49117.1 hypothetical protein C7Y66_10860 [Chroococcidiopsis sp. CCALA 051]